MPLSTFKPFIKKKKNAGFKVAAPHSLSVLFVLGNTPFDVNDKSSHVPRSHFLNTTFRDTLS